MSDAPRTLLAVDDEYDILLILRTALKDDFRVLAAGNGADALATAAEQRPDIILLDMMMPEMDGFEVLRRLRENEATAAIPVIFLTGVSERAKMRRALDNGVPYYIVKPFRTHELMHKINQALAVAASTTTTT